MAEIYPLGENRIFYRTSTNSQPDEITVRLLDPELDNNFHETLKPVIDKDGGSVLGLYSFWADFSKEGTYIAIFSEDGVVKISQAFSTRKIPAKGFRSSPGGNVINI